MTDRPSLVAFAASLSRSQLAELLPHGSNMVMLDRIEQIDDDGIHCVSVQHRAPDNSLAAGMVEQGAARSGAGSALLLIEFAAQAIALHESVLARYAGGSALPMSLRYVGQLKQLEYSAMSWQEIAALDWLDIRASQELAGVTGAIYRFVVEGGGCILCQGKITLVNAGQA